MPTDDAPSRRNPAWERDELILALDLYLTIGLIDDTDERVTALSETLNTLPLHPLGGDERFRNANGVHLKLANFAALDPSYPGAGMTHVGALDEEVWDELHSDRARVHGLAQAILSEAHSQAETPLPPEEDEEFADEGRLLFRSHRLRERDSGLSKRKKQRVIATTGRLACEACDFEFGRAYGPLGEGFIECHHIVPLASAGRTRTLLRDLALVCSNCHRMLHRGSPAPTVADLRLRVRTSVPPELSS